MIEKNEDYWSARALREYQYKGEKLYTITAAPYYVKRREIIIRTLRRLIKKYRVKKIADLGCGDGEYLRILYNDNYKFTGVDISSEMLKVAKERCKEYSNVNFECSGDGIKGDESYDMIYIVAVLAHITDDTVNELIQNAYNKLKVGGVLCICEQIAPYELQGSGWKRRTFERYVAELENKGFIYKNNESFRIDFNVHRMLFERRIAKLFYKNKSRIECNKSIYSLVKYAYCCQLRRYINDN